VTAEPGDDPLLHRWAEADELLATLLEMTGRQRVEFLDARCAGDPELRQVLEELLLRSDDPGDAFLPPLSHHPVPGSADPPPAEAGARFGPFEVERLVGRGGLGAVYLARRVEGGFQQRVAIKLLLETRGPDLLRRFERERDILAAVDHPYIARLLDAGIAPEGRPYLVMEYVDGQAITRFCEEEELPVRARLRLFLRVCDAVAAAHAQLVVHRDLKPSNILVRRDGSPKLLDFGIARLLDTGEPGGAAEVTVTGVRALSPAYASPEQIRGERVTLASDIFQLGTLLYLLLTGRRPHEEAGDSPARFIPLILGADPPRPSRAVRAEGIGGVPAARVRSALQGDLDAIIMKALRKEPERRYGTAAALADDIRRHLDGLPVAVRGNSAAYRVRRFTRRNPGVVAALATVILALSAGVVGLAGHSARLEAERDRARLAADRAEAATGFLLGMFDLAGDSGGRDTLTVGALLALGEALLDERAADPPPVRIDLLRALAGAYERVGMDVPGIRVLERRAAEVGAHYGPAHLETLTALVELGNERIPRREWAQAIRALEAARAVYDSLPPQVARSDTARALMAGTLWSLSTAYRDTGRLDEAIAAIEESGRVRRLIPGAMTPERRRNDLAQRAYVLRGAGRYEEAAALYEEAVAIGRAEGVGVPPLLLNNYAALLLLMERLEDAEPLFRDARELLWPREGEPGTMLDAVHINLLLVLRRLGRHADALEVAREAEALLRASFPTDHWRVIRAIGMVGSAYRDAGDCAAGEPLLREAADRYLATIGPSARFTAVAWTKHAECLTDLGRFAEAEPALLAARPVLLADPNPVPSAIRANLEALVTLYERSGRPAEAHRYRALLAELGEDE
jgi:eukaryotic-like serine/threonine-protein kinase